jgi:hypothetical protein
MGSVVLFDLGAIMTGVGVFDVVAHVDMAMGLLTGFTVLTILLVDLTTALSGTAAHRVLGLVTSATATMVIVFALVWWVREDGTQVAQVPRVLLEIAALSAGAFGVWCSRAMPERGRPEPHHRLGLGDL